MNFKILAQKLFAVAVMLSWQTSAHSEDAVTVPPATASAEGTLSAEPQSGSALDENKVVDTTTTAEAETPKEEAKAPPEPARKAEPAALPPPVAKQPAPEAAVPVAVDPQAGSSLGDGSRISVDNKGFSIVAPEGWTVRRDLPRTSLYLQAPNRGDSEYIRNIGIVKFSGPKLINEITADEFSNYLVKNFPAASPEIVDYQLRNHQPVQMVDGREGILFYTDFKVRGRSMMQAHILVSSETHHYLVTYTDVADHFENPNGNTGFLAEAWEAMISIELNSPNPKPLEEAQNTFIYIGIAVILGIGFVVWRNRAAGRLYSDYGAMDPGEAALDGDPKSHAIENESMIESNIGSEIHTQATSAKVFSFKKKTKPTKGVNEADDTKSAAAEDIEFSDAEEIPRDKWKVS